MFQPPFRWDVTQRSRLGSLLHGEGGNAYRGFGGHLLPCCSRVLAFAGDADLVFVGRSPESIFDHLSGLLFDTSWFQRLVLLHFSMRFTEEGKIRAEHPKAIRAMRAYLRHLELHPEGIATRGRPVAFIDLVSTGQTFGHLIGFLHNWANDEAYDWSAVRRRIRIVGITARTKTSPNTWRWQQHADWVTLLGRGAVKNVSIERHLWDYLGNEQPKASRSYTPAVWGDAELSSPNREEARLKGLRIAYKLFETGRARRRRQQFSALLAKERAMRHGWFRALVGEIRG